jgi:hypothetical protein
MKKLILLMLLIPSLAIAGPTLEWRAMLVPPAHEPVVGNMVARYLAEVTPGYTSEHVRFGVTLKAWGVNRWVPPSVRGHDWEKFENSDYTVDDWRLSYTAKAELGPDWLHLTTEYYKPIDAGDWGGHGMERHYYWLVGFGGRYR